MATFFPIVIYKYYFCLWCTTCSIRMTNILLLTIRQLDLSFHNIDMTWFKKATRKAKIMTLVSCLRNLKMQVSQC